MKTPGFVIVWCGTVILVLSSVGQANQPSATVEDLAWMAGHWVGLRDGGMIEEIWSLPAGDNMIGSFRFLKEGKGKFYEFMLIEDRPGGPVLRLRHFSPDLVAWEEKEGALLLQLVLAESTTAAFEDRITGTRLTYQRIGTDKFLVILTKEMDGKSIHEEFEYSRKGGTGAIGRTPTPRK